METHALPARCAERLHRLAGHEGHHPAADSRNLPTQLDVLNPAFEIDGETVIRDTATLAALPRATLRIEVTGLRSQRLQIDDALDFLFQGI